jgi:hypothetical protein
MLAQRDVIYLGFHWHFVLTSRPKLGTKKKKDLRELIKRFLELRTMNSRRPSRPTDLRRSVC